MKNKYVMSKNQNRSFVQGRLNTYLFNNMKLARYAVDEDCSQLEGEALIAYSNFSKAYTSIMTTSEETDYRYLIKLHGILMNGLMEEINRDLPEDKIVKLEEMINQPAKANTEIAIDVMLFILEERLFKDGDVRVALTFANKIMMDNGCGFISIAPSNDAQFRRLLKEYHTCPTDEFKNWIYRTSIQGKTIEY